LPFLGAPKTEFPLSILINITIDIRVYIGTRWYISIYKTGSEYSDSAENVKQALILVIGTGSGMGRLATRNLAAQGY
jgi:hypothetical protein